MLTREDAQKQLEQEASKDWRDQALTAAASLDQDLRPTAYALLGYDEGGELMTTDTPAQYQRLRRIVTQAYAHLDEISGPQRISRLYGPLLPVTAASMFMASLRCWRLAAPIIAMQNIRGSAIYMRYPAMAAQEACNEPRDAFHSQALPYRLEDVDWLEYWYGLPRREWQKVPGTSEPGGLFCCLAIKGRG